MKKIIFLTSVLLVIGFVACKEIDKTCIVSVESGVNGTTVPSGIVQVPEGTILPIVFNPNPGYKAIVAVDGIIRDYENNTMNLSVMKDSKVFVSFEEDNLVFLRSGKWISRTESFRNVGTTKWITYPYDNRQVYEFLPNNYYNFYRKDWKGDGNYELKGKVLKMDISPDGKEWNNYDVLTLSKDSLVIKHTALYFGPENERVPDMEIITHYSH